MDIRCPKCAEPWDHDELHYVDGKTYNQARQEFTARGCAVFGTTCNPETVGSMAAQVAGAMYDLLGDDMDGAASMLDDFEFMGMLD